MQFVLHIKNEWVINRGSPLIVLQTVFVLDACIFEVHVELRLSWLLVTAGV